MAAYRATPRQRPGGNRQTANKYGGRGPGGVGGAGGVGGVGRPVVSAVRVVAGVGRPGGAGVGVALVVWTTGGAGGAGWRWWCRRPGGWRRWSRCSSGWRRRSSNAQWVAPEQVQGQAVALALLIAQLAVALRTRSATAAHPRGLVLLLDAGEDLAAAVAETTHEPAAAEAVIAWEVAE